MFVTKVEIPHSTFEINHQHNILTLGSCFSENIGKKLSLSGFSVDINPFGVLYNPMSVLNSLEILCNQEKFLKKDIFEYNSLWHSFSHSSKFSDTTAQRCLHKINTQLEHSREVFKNTDFLLLTFGTAWIYKRNETGKAVSNCHKLPSQQFSRHCLTVAEIVDAYSTFIENQHTNTQIAFTVSPIRHWKDGAHENNISKSILLIAIDELQQKYANVHYFPAYEIQLDELRDYRYYASDMLHPSDVAIEHIWTRFSDTYFSESTKKLTTEVGQIQKDLSHQPLHENSTEYQQFQKKAQQRKESFIRKYPFMESRI